MTDILEGSQQVELSAEEAQVLQQIILRESVLRELTAAVTGLEAVNEIADLVLKGPVELAIVWNKALIAGWKAANSNLANIARLRTCEQIALMEVEADAGSPNSMFWSNLRITSGC